jgi:hypothetical protein
VAPREAAAFGLLKSWALLTEGELKAVARPKGLRERAPAAARGGRAAARPSRAAAAQGEAAVQAAARPAGGFRAQVCPFLLSLPLFAGVRQRARMLAFGRARVSKPAAWSPWLAGGHRQHPVGIERAQVGAAAGLGTGRAWA